jgi:branched-chain amino acid transport system substrate-binding protein
MTYYDSVVVMALAATLTKSTSPAVFNKDVMTVTEPGSGKTVVTSFAAGKAALAAGKRIQYVGAAGVIDFNKWHNSAGGFEIAAYQQNGDLTLVNSITAANLAPLIK